MHDFKTIYKAKSLVCQHSLEGKKHVVVLEGGMSAERTVSLSSSRRITKSLINNGYRVTNIDMGIDIAEVLMNIKPDVVFNCLHGTYGEDGCIPGLLNILRIPYTHSGLLSSATAFDKERSREFFLAHDIKAANGFTVSRSDNYHTDPMPRPYVIKPINQGSSIGVEIILADTKFNFADYEFPYGSIIVEEYIKGREMQVAVLNGQALDILEIRPLYRLFYDYETKYTDGMAEHIIPVNIPLDIQQKIKSTAEKIFNKLGCNGIARVEFMYSEVHSECYVLEINTHPGMTPNSSYPEIAAYCGIDFDQLVEKILQSAKYE